MILRPAVKSDRRIFGLLIFFIAIILSGCVYDKVNTSKEPTRVWAPNNRFQAKMLTMKSVFTGDGIGEYAKSGLDLSACIDVALKNDPTIRYAWESARLAEAQAKQSYHQLYPNVNGNMGLNVSKEMLRTHSSPDSDSTGDKQKGVDQHINYGPGVEATYLLLDTGGRDASIKAALAYLYQQNLNFNQSIQELLLNIELAYFRYCASIENTNTYEDNTREAKRILNIIEKRCGAGLAARMDVHQARARLEDERYNLERSRGDMQEAKAQLMEAMGLPAYLEIEVTLPSKEIQVKVSEDAIISLINEGLANRQDIAALKASVREKEFAVKVADSKLWPTLNADGVVSYNKYDFYKKPVDPIVTQYRSDFNAAFVLQINWEIFDGYNNYYNKIAAKHELLAEREKLRQAEIGAARGVWSKYYIHAAASKSLEHSFRNLRENKKVYSMTLEGYRAGRYNIIDLVYTQKDLFSSKLTNIDNRSRWYTSLAELAYEVGSLSIDADINKKLRGIE